MNAKSLIMLAVPCAFFGSCTDSESGDTKAVASVPEMDLTVQVESISTDEAMKRLSAEGILGGGSRSRSEGKLAEELSTGLQQHYASYKKGEEGIKDFPYVGTIMLLSGISGKECPAPCVLAFIEAGADVNQEVSLGRNQSRTPVMMAGAFESLDLLKILVSHGADVNAKIKNSETALMLAVSVSDLKPEVVKILLAAGADVNAKDSLRGRSALMRAAYRGDAEVVKILLAAGADVNAKDEDDDTPLTIAARNDDSKMVDILLAAGADVNAKNKYNETALLLAVSCGAEVVKLLLAAGADVNAMDNIVFRTALMRAVVLGDVEVVKMLLAAGADVNVKSNDGKTALMLAVKPEIIDLLRAAGATK